MGSTYEVECGSGDAKWWGSPKRRNLLTPAKYAAKLVPLIKPLSLRILIEPGRFIAGNAGILVTKVEHVKQTGMKNFVIVDAAMNDLIRPAFYESYHEIVPVRKTRRRAVSTRRGGALRSPGRRWLPAPGSKTRRSSHTKTHKTHTPQPTTHIHLGHIKLVSSPPPNLPSNFLLLIHFQNNLFLPAIKLKHLL